MSKEKSFLHWLWFIMRRWCVYCLAGAFVGAMCGAACISLAGCIVGIVAGLTGGMYTVTVALFGGLYGLVLGAATGGFVGLLGWGIVGVTYPASSMFSTDSKLISSTIVWMRNATIFAVICYFSWCLCIGFFRQGFLVAVNENVLVALFGVPAIMGIGQIWGIWRAAIKLRNPQTEVQ